MRRKRVIIAAVIAAMLLSAFALNTVDADAAEASSTYRIKAVSYTHLTLPTT